MPIELIKPNTKVLPSYIDAIREAAFCNMALGSFADESPEEILQDPQRYINHILSMTPRVVIMLDGSQYSIYSHELFWLTDNDRFLGSVSLRYAGEEKVIEQFGGHIGIAIRPSLINRGYGVKAAALAWQLASEKFLERDITKIIVTCNPENAASRRLIEHNGGKLIEEREDAFGTGPSLIFEIDLTANRDAHRKSD